MKKLLSLIAFAGALIACDPENLQTTFEPVPAQAVINVVAVDINNPDAPASGFVVSSPSAGTVQGNSIVITANEASKYRIPAQTVSFNVEYKGETKNCTYDISNTIAGQKVVYLATVLVGKLPPPPGPGEDPVEPEPGTDPLYIFDYALDLVPAGEKIYWYRPYTAHNSPVAHSHDGVDLWYQNPTEFMIAPKIDYKITFGTAEPLQVVNIIPEFQPVVDHMCEVLDDAFSLVEMEDTYEAKISAYSLYAFRQVVTLLDVKCTIFTKEVGEVEETKAIGDINPFAQIVVKNVRISSLFETKEIAIPGMSHDYHYGHGHADPHDKHGYSANAGGGISYSE